MKTACSLIYSIQSEKHLIHSRCPVDICSVTTFPTFSLPKTFFLLFSTQTVTHSDIKDYLLSAASPALLTSLPHQSSLLPPSARFNEHVIFNLCHNNRDTILQPSVSNVSSMQKHHFLIFFFHHPGA